MQILHIPPSLTSENEYLYVSFLKKFKKKSYNPQQNNGQIMPIYFASLPNVTNCCSAESIIFEDRRALRLLSGREACAAAASLDKLSSLSKLNQ
ncbi:hypothetical protein T01_7931 [Trichinella spiralis]|uniref:Uncharacterized protein n=1 Tax=Trichinella spiralis TaxID=6334 RepID=A0A0V1AT19_TRISP|nr:hypothetical protein T01_7931 [Trichinella spiralis]